MKKCFFYSSLFSTSIQKVQFANTTLTDLYQFSIKWSFLPNNSIYIQNLIFFLVLNIMVYDEHIFQQYFGSRRKKNRHVCTTVKISLVLTFHQDVFISFNISTFNSNSNILLTTVNSFSQWFFRISSLQFSDIKFRSNQSTKDTKDILPLACFCWLQWINSFIFVSIVWLED